jgi:hypothetical protein
MKQLSERVSHIEQYLRDASERDRMGRLSPRFRETRYDSLADSDGSKGTFAFNVEFANRLQLIST